MNRWLGIAGLGVTIIVWGLVGWRFAAVTTARLGAVTTTWTDIDQPHPYLAWTPGVSSYTFETGRLRLGAGGSARFLVRPLARFRTVEITLEADVGIGLDDEHRNASQRQSGTAARRVYHLDDLVPLDGRYRFTVRGSTTDVGYLRSITLRYRR